MRKETKEQLGGGVVGLVLLFLVGYAIYDDRQVFKSFKERDETVITHAHIESAYLDARLRVSLNFWYIVDNERKEGQSSEINLSSRIIPRLVGNTIPMVYLKKDTETKILLLTTYAFKDVDLPFPDSLNWLKEYESW